jgi:hypothetical protein
MKWESCGWNGGGDSWERVRAMGEFILIPWSVGLGQGGNSVRLLKHPSPRQLLEERKEKKRTLGTGWKTRRLGPGRQW